MRIQYFPPFFDTSLKFSPKKSDFFSQFSSLLLFDSHCTMWSFSWQREKAARLNPSALARTVLYYNNFLWKWVYMETGKRDLNPRGKILRTVVYPPPVGNVYARRQCYASRVEIAKQNFSPSAAEDFMIRLKANSSAYKLVRKYNVDKGIWKHYQVLLFIIIVFPSVYIIIILKVFLTQNQDKRQKSACSWQTYWTVLANFACKGIYIWFLSYTVLK